MMRSGMASAAGQGEARLLELSRHAVRRRLDHPISHTLQHIAKYHHELVGPHRCILPPRTSGGAELQPRGGLVHQGQRLEVGVRAYAHVEGPRVARVARRGVCKSHTPGKGPIGKRRNPRASLPLVRAA